ncbi:tRNA (adenosine(37)-N6)-threonylcarbamoyltransferase complex ATPase subunit type 1 TsaE [Hyphobacterium sp.]|uniref:tRNA (adenosine(37)-N6)-threonylcarbamoyltransferase complex ATPase subunit type 1 TsaE n=1 Tax=Hyphobacterium sp. TaxID=2004662 RepID=UPI003BACB485
MSASSLTFKLPDAAATHELGARLARALKPADVVLLHGDLGMGKTTLARGVIEALTGVTDAPSPTYTLIQSYDTENGDWLAHADLYRIEDDAELDELGLDDAFEQAICLIEWPGRLGRWLPERRLDLHLKQDGAARIAEIILSGDWGDRLDHV